MTAENESKLGCTNTLKLPQFQSSEATDDFIRSIDHMFDILNSWNPCAKGYKAALQKSNKETWEAFLAEAYNYIINLQYVSGNLLYNTRRKTGFVGLLVAITNIKQIFSDLVERKNTLMKYILTWPTWKKKYTNEIHTYMT